MIGGSLKDVALTDPDLDNQKCLAATSARVPEHYTEAGLINLGVLEAIRKGN